jgi:hypothetical protein
LTTGSGTPLGGDPTHAAGQAPIEAEVNSSPTTLVGWPFERSGSGSVVHSTHVRDGVVGG